jgi:hypothetical protein
MDQSFAPGISDGRTGMAVDLGDHSSQEPDTQMSMGEEDGVSDEENFEHKSGDSSEKASLTAKLHEMERDVAALKRVLAFM